jgi:hypothetical protein
VPPEAAESLSKRLKQADSKSECQRIQCVWLRASLHLSSTQVAVAICWHSNSVKKLQAQYFLEGESSLEVSKSGWRYRENMSFEEKKAFLAPFFEKAKDGGLIVAKEVKIAYEGQIGRKVPKSTLYRMLDSHDWQKIMPMPRPRKKIHQKRGILKKLPSNHSTHIMR